MTSETTPRRSGAARTGGSGRNRVAVRDRVLLYLTGLGMADVASLELAAECLRRAGPDATAGEAMRILRELLCEQGFDVRRLEPARRASSFPPLNRKTMVSKRIGAFTLYGSAKKLALRVLRVDAGRKRRRA